MAPGDGLITNNYPSLGPPEYHTETLYRFEASHGYVNYANCGYGSPCLSLRCSLEIVKNLCAPIGNSKNEVQCTSSAKQMYRCPKWNPERLRKKYHVLHKLLTYLFDSLQRFFEISSIDLKFIPLKLMKFLRSEKNQKYSEISRSDISAISNFTTPGFPYVFDHFQIFLAGNSKNI